jgi:predicted DNA-binding transcriptional regulator YafY
MSELSFLFEILNVLPRYPEGITVAEIVERLELVGERYENPNSARRAVQRLLKKLEDEPDLNVRTVEDDRDAQGTALHWCFAKNAVAHHFPPMTTESALSWHLTESVLESVLPEGLRQQLREPLMNAASTITGLAHKGSLRRKIRVLPSRSFLMPPKIEPKVLGDVLTALIKEHPMRVKYFSRTQRKVIFGTIHPVLMVIQTPVIYIVGRMSKFNNFREFAVHRFEDVEVRPDWEHRPKMPFNPDEWLAESSFGIEAEPTRVEFFMPESLAYHLDETKLAPNQKMKKHTDGRMRVEATLHISEELVWWLTSFANKVEVRSPKRLRERIANMHAEAAAQYDNG